MSADVIADQTRDRYDGLVAQARESFDQVESKGWRLAELCSEAIDELRLLGFKVNHYKYPATVETAEKRFVNDLSRDNFSHTTAARYRAVWRKYGDESSRIPGLTFSDHALLLYRRKEVQRAVIDNRRRQQGKQVGVNAGSSNTSGLLYPYYHFSAAKTHLRRLLDKNVWEFPESEKTAEQVESLLELARRVEAKFAARPPEEPIS